MINLEYDEINLHELFKIVLKQKFIVLSVTIVSVISATIYSLTAKPIYRGTVTIEIGEVINSYQGLNNNQPYAVFALDNVNDLKEIIMRTSEVSTSIPTGATKILNLSIENSDPSDIKLKLENIIHFIENRHKEKIKLYKYNHPEVYMTHLIGNINIENNAVKPKKFLIITIGFISGLILGIFIVLFKNFVMVKNDD